MYIIIYSFLFLCFIFETVLGKNRRNEYFVISLFAIFSLFLLASLRWKTGNDWTAYYDFYYDATTLSYQSQTYELGFRALVQLCRVLDFDYTGFLFTVTFLQLIGFYFVFLRTKTPVLCILLFFSTYYLGYIGTIRQTIAISMCLISLNLYLNNKSKLSFLFVAVSFLFHFSSLVFLLIYFVPKKMKKISFYLLYLAVVIIFSIFIIPVLLDFVFIFFENLPLVKKLHDYYTIKSDLGDQASLIHLWYIKRIIMLFFFYILVRFFIPTYAYLFNLYLLGATIFFVFINVVPMLGLRGAEYFNVFEIILLSLTISSLRVNILSKLLIVLVISLPRLYTAVYNYHPELYIPYYSIFEKSDATRTMY